VSRVDSEERTVQFLKQYTGSVSKAVWPSSIRRYVATGKGRRRMMILKHLLMLYKMQRLCLRHKFDKTRCFCKGLLAGCSCSIHVIIIVIASDVVQMVCILYSWPILLMMTVVCAATMLIIVHLMSNGKQKYHEYGFLFKNKFKIIQLRREKRCLIESRLANAPQASISSSTEDEDEEIEQESVGSSFPDTPMPRTPLIRVMETIDLSSSKTEYLPDFKDMSVVKSTVEEHDQHPQE
jgi:hypothetical protein